MCLRLRVRGGRKEVMEDKQIFYIPLEDEEDYLKLVNFNCKNCNESCARTPYEIKNIDNFFNCDWCHKPIKLESAGK